MPHEYVERSFNITMLDTAHITTMQRFRALLIKRLCGAFRVENGLTIGSCSGLVHTVYDRYPTSYNVRKRNNK